MGSFCVCLAVLPLPEPPKAERGAAAHGADRQEKYVFIRSCGQVSPRGGELRLKTQHHLLCELHRLCLDKGGVKPLLYVVLSVGDAGGKGDVPGSLNQVSVQEEEPQVVFS